MLVRTWKNGDWIAIGQDVKILVKRARNGRVTLGIEAPHELTINHGCRLGGNLPEMHSDIPSDCPPHDRRSE